MSELTVDRFIASAGLPEGRFDAVAHPYLHIWLQSSGGRCRLSLGYGGKLPLQLGSCRGFRVIHDFEQGRRMNYIVFEETEFDLREPFATAMIAAITQSIEQPNAESSLSAFLVAVRDLKLFFGRQQLGLTAEELRGLMAELLTIQSLIEGGADVARVVEGWKAPDGAVRDFVFSSTHGLEVKSARPDSGTITISSVNQLDQDEPGLQLAVWPLVEVDDSSAEAVGLGDLLADIRERCLSEERALQRFDQAVATLGLANYIRADRPPSYSIGECRVFDVVDGFPRIRACEIPSQIRDVSYTLRTSDLASYASDLIIP